MAATIYEVKLRYQADDKASKGLNSIATAADRAHRSTFGLKSILGGIGVGLALREGKKHLIDYNVQIQEAKIGMATLLNMQLKKPFVEALSASDKLVDNLRKFARSAPGETKDYIEMASMIAPSVAMMGGDERKIEKLAKGAVVAGLVAGVRADMAALDIQQMLMGSVTARDRMASQLIASRGMSREDFNKLGGKERSQMTEDLLASPSIMKGAKALSETFSGRLSTLKDTIRESLGKIGLPLMQRMTKEIQTWITWIEKHPVQIGNIVNKVSSGLRTGFGYVKSAFEFVAKHADTLMALAKAFIMFKAVRFGTGLLQSGVQGMASMIGSASGAFKTVGDSATSLAGKFSSAIGIIGAAGAAGAALIQMYADYRMNLKERDMRKVERFGAFSSDISSMEQRTGDGRRSRSFLAAANRTLQTAGEVGLVRDGKINEGVMREAAIRSLQNRGVDPSRGFGTIDREIARIRFHLERALIAEKDGSIAAFKALRDTAEQARMQLRMSLEAALDPALRFFGMGKEEAPEWKGLSPDKANVNVTIHKIEVESQDPDRFVFGAVKAFEKAAKTPTQAETVIAGGF